MRIRNVKVYREDKTFAEGEICIKKGIFVEKADVSDPEEEVMDGEGCFAIPGLIDIHLHGCMGYDFCDGTQEAIREIAGYEASVGVTGMVLAAMTLPAEELERILAAGAAYSRKQKTEACCRRADFLGVNMEGPFISREKKGAQDERNILPCDVELFRRFQKAAEGTVNFIGVAPEREGATEFIKALKDQVHVSLAHTNADYDSAKAAFDAGACHVVHLYNAMPPFLHRAPGVVGAVSDSPHVMTELICDGIHVHPAMVRAALKMLGEDRVIFISDSMRAAGMPDGRYTLGGLDVDVKGKRAVLASDGNLAGSVATLMDCVRIAVKQMDIPLETAVACAAVNPARSLGVYESRGSITLGKKADLVLLDEDLSVRAVLKDGKVI